MQVLENFKDLFFDVWNKGISGVNISEIVIALFIFLFFLFLRGIFSKFVIKRLENYVSKTTNNFDNSLVFSMEGPAKFFPIVLGFFVSTSYLTIESQAADFIETVNRSLITILIFWTFHQIIGPLSVVIKSVGDLISRDLVNWIIKAIKVLIFILGVAAVLELWGIKIGPIIAGLGLFGVAVALGAQDLFKNLISGILVLVERRFQVGDWIFVEDVIEGTVESIGFRSTVVRRFDKSLATIPNFQFAEKAVINNSLITNRRISWVIGLEYRTTSKQLTDIKKDIEEYIKNSKLFTTSGDTILSVKIEQFAASSIDIKLICFTKTKHYLEWMKVKDILAIEIKDIVEKHKASFAFPSTSIYVEKN
jgi:MscS family membrane protein